MRVVARWAFLATVLVSSLQLRADTPQIKGEVEDVTGARIPNARVLLIDLSTLATETTTTDREGWFSFTNLRIVDYEIKVASSGFVTHSEKVSFGPRKVIVPGEQIRSVTLVIKMRIGPGGSVEIQR